MISDYCVMSSYQHKFGAHKKREKQQCANEEKRGSRTLFDVGAFKDNAEAGSKAELEHDPQDTIAQTIVSEPRQQASEVEITDSGAYCAPDDVEDEGDVNVDDDSEKPLTEDAISKEIEMTTCEENDTKFGLIA